MSKKAAYLLVVGALVLPTGLAAAQGLKGEYFSGMSSPWTPTGDPVLTRIENVNFNWESNAPDPSVGADNFSVRWTGGLTPPVTAQYVFRTRTDDGIRVWINDEPVIDNWTDHGTTWDQSEPVELEGGRIYRFRVEFYENGGGAVCELYWRYPGQSEQVVPTSVLSPEPVYLVQARKPSPADGATGVAAPLLTWTPGETASWHDVYFGTDPEALGLLGRQMWTMYYYAMPLEPRGTYYWRVDEVEKDAVTVYTGDLWSFTMASKTAWAPYPRNGDKWISETPTLTWKGGLGATAHDVYFSTDANAVVNRDPSAQVVNQQPLILYEPGALQAGVTYYWVVDEYDLAGTKTDGEVWSFTVTDDGGGVKGEYFNNQNLSGVPVVTRVDPNINFNWGSGTEQGVNSPDATIAVDHFSARWRADLEIAVADTYTFVTRTGDGSRLWLNGELIIDQWVDQGPLDALSEPQELEPGIYSLRMEYYENDTAASAELYWETPVLPRQIIPAGPLQLPLRAGAINPKPGDVNQPQDITLMWSAGERAAQHQIYFGDDRDAVADATASTAGIYRGQQGLEQTSYNVSGLEWNKTYYWRIDEINPADPDSPWKGSPWKFTTADYIVIDDFEIYGNEVGNRVFQVWVDGMGYTEPAPGKPGNGTGALVGHDIWSPGSPHYQGDIMETANPHGGRQAMPLYYDNSFSPYKSEADRTWTTPQNWTVNGVTDLSLWFHGNPVGFLQTADGITMSASGEDIWGTADEFRYVYKPLNGNGSITVRVDSIMNTDAWAKGGVMVREGLEAGAKHVMLVVTPGSGVQFTWRDFTNADMTEHNTQAGIAPPCWIRLTRTGNTFKAEHSANGTSWQPVVDAASNTHQLSVLGNVYIGLCLTSHNVGAVTVAEFSNLSTSGGVSGQWQVAEIGVEHPSNDRADLYVAVEDSMGRTGVVSYPEGAVVPNWTEWKIPLTEFSNAGVNLAAIKAMHLGVGNRNLPVADGAGDVYFDDIRVVRPAPVEEGN